jgi:Cu+-exporting ATPase
MFVAMTTAHSFTLAIDGMHCAGCVRRVQGALEKIPGVVVDEVVVGRAKGTFDADATELAQAVTKAGYAARVVEESGGA